LWEDRALLNISLSELKPGMKLAKDVMLSDGRLLLLAGFVIKPSYIERLKSFGITHVFIEEDQFTPVSINEEEKVYKHAASMVKEVFQMSRNGLRPNISAFRDTVNEVITKVMEKESIMLQLTGIRDIDNYTFLHSIDVCIYSTIIGKNLGYDMDTLTLLGMGAVLHDIGKCKIPAHLLRKPGSLSEDEYNEIKEHSVLGYEIIRNSYGLNEKIASISLQHHERWDGSGYPSGLMSYNIDPFARIIALADVYDALISDRIYKKRYLPDIAAKYISKNSGTLFDPKLVEVFVNSIVASTEGTLVLLSTGELGSVIPPKVSDGSRQLIYVFSNKFGPPVFEPYIIDLNEHREIEIVKIFV